MSSIRRRTTRRRSIFANAPSEKGPSPFPAYAKALDEADSFMKVLTIALKNELSFYHRPMDMLAYRKVSKKVSEVLEEFISPLLNDEVGRISYADGLIPMENLKFKFRFITNMQYFPATGKFEIHDPFLLDALVPDEENSVLVCLYLRMPPTLEELPPVNAVPKGAIPFIRVTYRIVRGNQLYTGETREKWKWNLPIPAEHPLVLGLKNGEAGRLAVEVRHP